MFLQIIKQLSIVIFRCKEERTLCTEGQSVRLILLFSVPELLRPVPLSHQAYNTTVLQKERPSRDSSVGKEIRYGLNGPAGKKFGLSVQRAPRPTLPPMQGLSALSPGESGWNVVLTTHTLLTPGLRMGWNYTFTSTFCLHVLDSSFIFTQ